MPCKRTRYRLSCDPDSHSAACSNRVMTERFDVVVVGGGAGGGALATTLAEAVLGVVLEKSTVYPDLVRAPATPALQRVGGVDLAERARARRRRPPRTGPRAPDAGSHPAPAADGVAARAAQHSGGDLHGGHAHGTLRRQLTLMRLCRPFSQPSEREGDRVGGGYAPRQPHRVDPCDQDQIARRAVGRRGEDLHRDHENDEGREDQQHHAR